MPKIYRLRSHYFSCRTAWVEVRNPFQCHLLLPTLQTSSLAIHPTAHYLIRLPRVCGGLVRALYIPWDWISGLEQREGAFGLRSRARMGVSPSLSHSSSPALLEINAVGCWICCVAFCLFSRNEGWDEKEGENRNSKNFLGVWSSRLLFFPSFFSTPPPPVLL